MKTARMRENNGRRKRNGLEVWMAAIISVACFILFLGRSVIFGRNESAQQICLRAENANHTLNVDRKAGELELQSSAYVKMERQRQLAERDRVHLQSVTTLSNACLMATESEKLDTDFRRLTQVYDLDRIKTYPEEERLFIYRASNVPPGGPHSFEEQVQVLRALEKNTNMYH